MKRILTLTAAMFLTIGAFAACNNSNRSSDNSQTASVIELNSEEFNKLVYNINDDSLIYLGDKPAIVDFTATWCGPCKRIAPILEELAAEYEGKIVIYKVDVDKCGDIARAFDISSIPAILYIPVKGGPQMTIGSRGKDKFIEEIQSILLK